MDKAIGWVSVSKRGLIKGYLWLLLFLVVSVAVSWNDLSFWFVDDLSRSLLSKGFWVLNFLFGNRVQDRRMGKLHRIAALRAVHVKLSLKMVASCQVFELIRIQPSGLWNLLREAVF